MPTLASMRIPTPKSWDEFEDITLSAAKLRWNSTDFSRHGRQGQEQDGVDIYGHDDDQHFIGLQCKNTPDGISLSLIKKEIKHAEQFSPKLDRLYIATTAKRDAPIQKKLRDLSSQRSSEGKFKVDILFWDDICQELAKDENVFFQHYPRFQANPSPAKQHDKELFEKLTSLLKLDGVIGFINYQNMAGFYFRTAELDPIREFYFEWNHPEREFIIPELDALRKLLWEKVSEYYALICSDTFPANNPDFSAVPPEWEIDQPERFRRVVKKFNALANEIVSLHAQLVRDGRRILIGQG